jgi:glyoxylase-like metal-dependent hydrolase (beta-lactamase superfamily II)
MTLDGTNTWVLRRAGARGCVVVDPGPLHEEHLATVAPRARSRSSCSPTGTPTTARAPAASPSSPARRAGARPGAPAGQRGARRGDVVAAAGLELRVLATPGHTSDSLSFLLPGEGARRRAHRATPSSAAGTTVVAHPDGVLADYLTSLRRLRELGDRTVLPGHGPRARPRVRGRALPAPPRAAARAGAARLGGRRAHRRGRRRGGLRRRRPALWPAATLSVRAQLDHLRGRAGP